MSLPAPTPHLTTECSFLSEPGCLRGSSVSVRNGPGLHLIPDQHPGGRTDDLQRWCWTWTLSKIRVVKMIGIKQKHMVCSLQAESNTDGYLCGEGGCGSVRELKLEFGWSSCCETEMEVENERGCLCLCCSLLGCLSPPCLGYLTVASWVVSSSAKCTMCCRS